MIYLLVCDQAVGGERAGQTPRRSLTDLPKGRIDVWIMLDGSHLLSPLERRRRLDGWLADLTDGADGPYSSPSVTVRLTPARTAAERGVMFPWVRRPSPAMVVACIALIVGLSGTSYAKILALPLNSVGTPQLKANAVISSKVRDHTLLAADFKPGQLPPRGIQGYEVVSPPPNIVMNDIHNSIFMTCPAGKRAIGGGGATGGGIVPGDGPYITSNLPSVDGTGWLVDTTRAVSGYSALVGRIICADVP